MPDDRGSLVTGNRTAAAVVGLGAMGSRIARRLHDTGHELSVWNRDAAKCAPLVELGATEAASPAQAAMRADAVVTMVSDPTALREVTEGPDGAMAGMSAGKTLIQMSTVGTAEVIRLAETLTPGSLLDAPVLGSVAEAESGRLTIFVGGPEPVVERCRPLLSALGSVVYVGPVGAGSSAKLVANTALLGVLGVLGEALALGNQLGLSRNSAFEVLDTTPLAAQASRRRPSIERSEYPRRFALSLARKDGDLILAAARESGTDLRLTAAARAWFAEAEDAGLADRDYSAVLERIVGPWATA
jgi:3-hydroxyisobutyrate dehydrogenase-like beta-hydroxyacid dehydrogenase